MASFHLFLICHNGKEMRSFSLSSIRHNDQKNKKIKNKKSSIPHKDMDTVSLVAWWLVNDILYPFICVHWCYVNHLSMRPQYAIMTWKRRPFHILNSPWRHIKGVCFHILNTTCCHGKSVFALSSIGYDSTETVSFISESSVSSWLQSLQQ